ncbi:hypothetical protein N2152v2_005910 [Parachlorella kessleri]
MATFTARAFTTRPAVAIKRNRGHLQVRAATAIPSEFRTVSPVGDRVFVMVEQAEEKTSSGILLPSSAQKKPTQGEIVGAGSAKAVKAGDKVVYSKYAGTEIKLQDSDYVLLKEDDVIGLLSSPDVSQLKPLQDRVLIEVLEAEAKTKGGLVLTEGAKEKPTMGKVVAVGPGKADEEGKASTPAVTVGSTVLYQKYSGTEFEGDNGKQYIVVREADIMAAIA